jgi:4-hydroxyphenylacetate decarboxylase small subunit
MQKLKHMDCRNYAALDVAKGVCHRTKELVPADADHCEQFVATQKCKFCEHFVAVSEHLGTCGAEVSKPMAYPDLITVTCENFGCARAAKA